MYWNLRGACRSALSLQEAHDSAIDPLEKSTASTKHATTEQTNIRNISLSQRAGETDPFQHSLPIYQAREGMPESAQGFFKSLAQSQGDAQIGHNSDETSQEAIHEVPEGQAGPLLDFLCPHGSPWKPSQSHAEP